MFACALAVFFLKLSLSMQAGTPDFPLEMWQSAAARYSTKSVMFSYSLNIQHQPSTDLTLTQIQESRSNRNCH